MAISDRTRKILWVRAGGRCSICRIQVVTEATPLDDPSVFGEEAHIIARGKSGPRAGNISSSDSYDNLILLCRQHHKQVDDQSRFYTADRLREIKRAHEEWVATLDETALARNTAEQLLAAPLNDVRPPSRFDGIGLYALYYQGEFLPYSPIASPKEITDRRPIYVGRCVAPGLRHSNRGNAPIASSLYNRLLQHEADLRQAENLHINDFYSQYLVADNASLSLAQSILFDRYDPIWNTVIEGFGNHNPGKGRSLARRSDWDTIHPGRPWAKHLLEGVASAGELTARLAKHFAAKRDAS
jgi:hypothetical protein